MVTSASLRNAVGLRTHGRVTRLSVMALFVLTIGSVGAHQRLRSPVPHDPPASGATPQAHLLVRTGDLAPVQARVDRVLPGSVAQLPDGALVYITGDESAVEIRKSPGQAHILLHLGDRIPECGTVSDIFQLAAGSDGTIAVRLFCYATQAIVRVDAGGGAPVTALRTGMTLPIGGTPVLISRLLGPAVDGQGRIFAAADGGPQAAALVRQSAGAAPEVLLQSGDPLGTGTFLEALREPAVNSGGTMAFSASISGDMQVIATLTPEGASTVLFSIPIIPNPPGQIIGPYPQPLGLSPPALNDSGVVAFLDGEPDASGHPGPIRVLRAMGGAVQTIAAAGDPAPGGDSFSSIDWVYPAVDVSGAVYFGARRSTGGPGGLYRFDTVASAIAESGQDTGGGETVLFLDSSAAALPCADGAVRFSALDTAGPVLLAARDGQLSVEMRPGEPMTEPGRFVRFDSFLIGFPSPHLAAGPFMARGGAVIFDAWVSGRGRGLFARAKDGTLSAVALDGDPAPGGGHFDSNSFSFHSIADGGRFAFAAEVAEEGTYSSLHLFTGVIGGPLTEVIGEYDWIPGSDIPIFSLMPPSGINSSGAILVPVLLSGGGTALLAWDGAALRVIAASGDTLPDGETIEAIQTGQPPYALLAPLLDEAGSMVFGVVTSSGHAALYRTTLAGGIASAARILGDGDPVEGGVLQPFLLRALARDAGGRLAFQAVPAPGPGGATYVARDDGAPERVAGPGDTIDSAVVIQALPRLAATLSGVVHETSNTHSSRVEILWLATPRLSPGSEPGFDETPLNLSGMPSPDGGFYIGGVGAIVSPGALPPFEGRIASDGDRYVVSMERTTAGPEDLVLFDLRPNRAPVADAGVDQRLECTGPDGAEVTLDAGGSTDSDNDPLQYTWTGPFGTVSGPMPTVTLPVGNWTITLTARDPAGESGVDTLIVLVQDTVAPAIVVRALPDRLWPPDGRLVPVSFAVTTHDVCDAAPGIVLEALVSDDPNWDPVQDVSDAAFGTDDHSVNLRARRSGRLNGRTYTATYVATDRSGNRAHTAVTILVPHDRGR